MDMLYESKDKFSLRDEIGTCLNIEVEVDVIDKSPFFIRPYHCDTYKIQGSFRDFYCFKLYRSM